MDKIINFAMGKDTQMSTKIISEFIEKLIKYVLILVSKL